MYVWLDVVVIVEAVVIAEVRVEAVVVVVENVDE